MKEIKLLPDKPFFNSVDVAVMDFPNGLEAEPRKRCKITVEYAKVDVEQLKKRGLSFDEAMEYYEEWLYKVVKVRIAQDWTCVGGHDEVMAIIKEKVGQYY